MNDSEVTTSDTFVLDNVTNNDVEFVIPWMDGEDRFSLVQPRPNQLTRIRMHRGDWIARGRPGELTVTIQSVGHVSPEYRRPDPSVGGIVDATALAAALRSEATTDDQEDRP